MSLFGDIGNIFHSIGHFFAGGDDNNQNTGHPVSAAPVAPHPAPGPVYNNAQNTPFQSNSQNPQKVQPQQAPVIPGLNLYQGPSHAPQAGSFDPNAPLNKVAPQPSAQPAQPQPSIIHQIENGAKNVGEALGGAATAVPLGVLRTGEGLVQGVTDLPDLATHALTYLPRKLAGDDSAVNRGLSTVNRGVDTATHVIDAPQKWLENKTDQAVGMFGPDNTATNTAEALYKPTQVAANVATLLPAATAVAGKVGEIGNLSKVIDTTNAVNKFVDAQRAASPAMQALDKVKAGIVDQVHADWNPEFEANKVGTATDTKVATGVQAPDEVAVGLKSANPNQGTDALQAIQEREAQAQAQVLQPEAKSPQGPATPPVDPTQPIAQSGQPSPAAPASPQLPLEPAAGQTMQRPTPAAPQLSPEAPENSLNPSSEPPIVNTPNNVAQRAGNVNQAPNAPGLRDQLEKNLKAVGTKVKLDDGTHDVLTNADLNDAADRYIASYNDEDLVNTYAKGANIHDAQSMAAGNAALKRLGEMSKAGDVRADTAIENILDGAAEGTSKAGRLMNYTQSLYDQLPQPAKVKYIVRAIDKAREASGLAPLNDAEGAAAEQTIDHLLTETQQYSDAASQAEAEIEAIKAKIGTGQITQDDLNKIAEYDKIARTNQLAAGKTQGDLARAYDQLAPQPKNLMTPTGRQNLGNNWGNMARSLMLTSISGRVSDVATTSLNVLHTLTQNSIEGLIGKGLEALRSASGKDPGKYIDTVPSGSAMLHGTGEGLQKAAGNYAGNTYVDDVARAIKDSSRSEGGKTQLARAGNSGPLAKVRNFAHAMAETATNLSQGVSNTKVLQLAYREGKARGLSGLDLDVYAHSTAALPTRAMAAKGAKLVEEVNNMNDNPFTHGLESAAKGLDKIPILGEQVRNLIAPFNRWVGGQMWNGLTDKNAVANVIKAAKQISFKDGHLSVADPQELVHQVAGLATNTIGTMGAGYAMAASGVLTTKNGEGYNDDGLYLHVGGHFIPVSFFGFAAPGMIMGWATHEAFKNTGNGDLAQNIMQAAGSSLDALGKAYLQNTVIGGGSQVLNSVQHAIQGKDGTTWGDVGAEAASEAAGDYIPGIGGDVNSAINTFNLGNMNPTHEAALTKVTKGDGGEITKTGTYSSAKDEKATVINQLLNKIPVESQRLPRNSGVPANDFGSRVTRGDNQSSTQKQEQFDAAHPSGPAKVKTDLAADKAAFVKQNEEMGTINGKTYINYKGNVSSYDDPMKAQQALDYAKFKDSGKDEQHVNGMVYFKGSDGKYSQMEQKDYDYKQASDQITSAKNSGDVTGYTEGHQKLLGNIGWQLAHADLTSAQRDQLTQRAVQAQEDFAKVQQYGGFTKPKDAPAYATPQITGAKDGYVRAIQEAGAKYGVDVNALLSVAAQEGLGGGVGDNGTSFGPFQMHQGGALPPGKDQKWAESPEGIDYAVQQIANVAKGKIGPEAIKAIVTQFEKSADQPGEIARALELYTGGKATLSPGAAGGSGVSITPSDSSTASAQKAADLVKQNKIGSLPVMARESFINDMSSRPVPLNLPQVKLTSPGSLIKAHKITVGMPKA